jgi:hypothetical protein
MSEEKPVEEAVAMPQRPRFRRALPKIGFLVFFLGPLVLECLPAGPKLELAWLLFAFAWATLIRWWMVAGLIGGILCLPPPSPHVFDFETKIRYAAIGAAAGLACEFLDAGCRRYFSRKVDQTVPG